MIFSLWTAFLGSICLALDTIDPIPIVAAIERLMLFRMATYKKVWVWYAAEANHGVL